MRRRILFLLLIFFMFFKGVKAEEYSDKFNLNVNLVTIKDFGGWDAVQEKHFADGGVFDEIYEKK